MFWKSPLQKELDRLLKGSSESSSVFSIPSVSPVGTESDARAICSALDSVRDGKLAPSLDRDSTLTSICAYFQYVEDEKAFNVLVNEGLPRLRYWVTDLIENPSENRAPAMFMLKVLAIYRQQEDVELIARVANCGIGEDDYIWFPILECFDAEHPYRNAMIDALREPLPKGLILVSLLDLANATAIDGKLSRHPFDTDNGRINLERWLSDADEDNFSYALSSTAALPFIEPSCRQSLLEKALNHPDPEVQLEAAWAQAKSGDSMGIDRLIEYSLIPGQSLTAQNYLEELGHGTAIPDEARDANFRAVAEMAKWLAFPTEFGRPPDEIELFDTRELFWPPTNDRQQVFLVRYSYFYDDEEPDHGIGMVGPSTFCLFGETTAEMSAEDIYALHCAWELEMNGDPRTPELRSVSTGREILQKYNPEFR